MKSFMSWLFAIFVIFFWIFRVIVCLTTSMGIEFMGEPYNLTTEIVLLFVTILSIILIIKRNFAGALLYFFTYSIYFGFAGYAPLMNVIEGSNSFKDINELLISGLAILLSLLIVIDVLLDRKRTSSRGSKITRWFYDNKDFDRELDERADKNNYKIR